jgi:hypothetical protein
MSVGGRANMRGRVLRRAALLAAVLLLLTLVFLLSGHWVLAVIFGAAAAGAIWGFLQARTVR